MTIQIDPNVTGFLKLPDLLDMMSRIILERNYDAQIEDAFRWDRPRSDTEMRMCYTGTRSINLNSKFCLDLYWQPKIKCEAEFIFFLDVLIKMGLVQSPDKTFMLCLKILERSLSMMKLKVYLTRLILRVKEWLLTRIFVLLRILFNHLIITSNELPASATLFESKYLHSTFR